MIRKNHTRNQRRMYRIHKQEERIQDLELLVGELRQEYNKVQKMYEETFADYQKEKEVIDMFLNIVDKNKMLLNNPDLLDLYLKIKRCQNER